MIHERRCAIRDIEVAYSESGDGPAVVLVHGLAEDQRSFAPVQKALPDFHAYAYSLRGHSATTLGNADGSLQQLGEDLLAFLQEVSGPAACIGYSLGGTIVLWAAARRPDLVVHAIVAGTSTVVGKAAVGYFENRIRVIGSDRAAFDKALRDDTAAGLLRGDVDVDVVTGRRLQAVGDGGGYVNAARAMIGVGEKPLTPALASIDCPVDVIGAEGDAFCPRKAADIIMAELKHGNYHEIGNAGHLIGVDQPEAYAAVIRKILTRSKQ